MIITRFANWPGNISITSQTKMDIKFIKIELFNFHLEIFLSVIQPIGQSKKRLVTGGALEIKEREVPKQGKSRQL